MHLELCKRLGIIVCGMFIKPFIHAIMKMGEASITPSFAVFTADREPGPSLSVWGGLL